MGHARVAHRDPPALQGGEIHGDVVTYQRDIRHAVKSDMEEELSAWVGRYVSRSRRAELMYEARESVEAVLNYIKHAPLPLAIEKDGGAPRYRVYLHLLFGVTSKGQWWVRSISFGMNESGQKIAVARQRETRERLEEQAKDRQARAPVPRWKLYFDASDGTGNFALDVRLGKDRVKWLIDNAHALAKDLEPTMKNPIGWDGETDASLALETGKAVLGTVASVGGDYARKGVQQVVTGIDGATKIGDNANTQDGFKAAGDIVDLGLGLASGGNPVSALGSQIVGMFLSIAIANDTVRVARARARLFAFYIGGFLERLTDEPFDKPKESARKKMYQLGTGNAAALSPQNGYQIQLALLQYAATHDITNKWNFNPDIDKGWVFPTHYQSNWSPEILARSFVWQINRLKYLTK